MGVFGLERGKYLRFWDNILNYSKLSQVTLRVLDFVCLRVSMLL